jgi:hypothetical protein
MCSFHHLRFDANVPRPANREALDRSPYRLHQLRGNRAQHVVRLDADLDCLE